MIEGFYYLHSNGELIYKRALPGTEEDLRDSDFVVTYWIVDPSQRIGGWQIGVEALAAGARRDRVMELAEKWHLTDDDALIYAKKIGAIVRKDGSAWVATRSDFVNLQESPAGFGDSALEALADLAKDLGYSPRPLGSGFHDLLFTVPAPAPKRKPKTP